MGLEKYLEEGEEVVCKVRRSITGFGIVLFIVIVGSYIEIASGHPNVGILVFAFIIFFIIFFDYYLSRVILTNKKIIIKSIGNLWQLIIISLDEIEKIYPGGGKGGLAVEINLKNGKHLSFSDGYVGTTIYEDFKNLSGE